MTERLYYTDPSLTAFEAVVTDTGTTEGRHWVALDRSAFYPTSGGQLHDVGTINGTAVVDVVEADDGAVRHIVSEPVGDKGTAVQGEVDAERRRRFRQEHTAQHILSQAFIRLFDLETVSVHLGEEYGAIELETDNVSDEQLAQVEQYANDIIRDNHGVVILFVDPEEAHSLPLRKIPEQREKLRVIRIDDFDWSACGGTHCSSTAEVGYVKITGTERVRKRTLVKYLAGDLVFDDYRMRFDITDSLSGKLTCHPEDLPGKVDKLEVENRELRRQTGALQKELLPMRAKNLAALASETAGMKMVGAEVDDLDAKLTSQLAGLVAEETGGLAMLIAEGRVIIGVAPNSGLHAGQLAKALSQQTELKGGGGAAVAQLGGATPDRLGEYRNALLRVLSDA